MFARGRQACQPPEIRPSPFHSPIAKSAEEYTQRLNLSMASADIPDILELDQNR